MINTNVIVAELLPKPEGFEGNWGPIIPKYNPKANAGMDLSTAIDIASTRSFYKPQVFSWGFEPSGALFHHTAVVRTGLRMALPRGYHMRIASRSGLGFKQNILAFPGTIDNSYRGEIIIRLDQISPSPEGFSFTAGDRIAQGILFEVPEHIHICEGEVNENTERGAKGFGSTGL
jgi:deoxyuridine 5'-triphosphate nucleotidohydrolase